MTYEVYLDELFVRNLWMDLLLLALTGWADHASMKKRRIAAAAAAGAAGACLMAVLSAGISAGGYLLGEALLAAGMTGLAFSERRRFAVRFFLLYIECFALNGLLRFFEQLKEPGKGWILPIGTVCFLALAGAERFLREKKRRIKRSCRVTLRLGSASVSVEALLDTGNSLKEPATGKPVSMIRSESLESLIRASGLEKNPLLIPYQTISEHGLLEAYALDSMELLLPEESLTVEKPLVARMPLTSGTYPMILHRDLLPS